MDRDCLLLLHATLGVYLLGAVVGLVFCKRNGPGTLLSFGASLVGSSLAAAAALLTLLQAGAAQWQSVELWPSLIPYVKFTGRLDALGALFLLILSVLGAALSLFSLGYVRGYDGRKSGGILGAFFNALLLSTVLVFLADNAFFFLMAWELMALTAFCLVSFEHEDTEARSAGVLYFIMSHIGTGCLILGFLLLFTAAGSYEFAAFHHLGERLPAPVKGAAFLLFLAGFGVKAGIVPLHIWLPAAHPVAPSNVSALLSGLLIKTGIYGLTRVYFDFLGTPPLWWGVTVLSLGTISAVLGVLYALMEHDLKRLLAYHSIENIGIILMGLGAALMFLHAGRPVFATLALLAGLYHTMNHATFKALLFLGAGSVLHATKTRNMEELGGLIKRMPQTAAYFLIGAVAISALPPLNGFVSEWLTYQALLQGFASTEHLIRILFPISGAMLALTGALAAACFVKAFGITFLAQPRSASAAGAHEVSLSMRSAQAGLALVCVGLGLFPTAVLRLMDPVARQLTGMPLGRELALSNGLVLGNTLVPRGGTVSTLGIAVATVILLSIPLLLRLLFARRAKVRFGATWDCGLRGLTPHMQYSATGFSKPIRMVFKALFRPRRELQQEYDYSPYFAKTIRFESHVEELFEKRVYRPLHRLVLQLSRKVRALQAGSIQAYLIYIFVTLLILLVVSM